MRVLLFVSVLAVAGCASSPEVQEPSSPRAARASTADILPTPSRRARAVNAASQEKVTPELRAAWEARNKERPQGNFTLVMKDGKEYFCRREAPTGSKMKRVALCLTREELAAVEAETQRQLRDFQSSGRQSPRSPLEPAIQPPPVPSY
jgi:hypothetical protein